MAMLVYQREIVVTLKTSNLGLFGEKPVVGLFGKTDSSESPKMHCKMHFLLRCRPQKDVRRAF